MSVFRQLMMKRFHSAVNYMPLTKVGSPTITDGVVSGFSSGDYLKLLYANLPTTINNFEIQLNIITPSTLPTFSNYECICGQEQFQNYRTPQIEMFDNKCRMIISPNGSSWINGNELSITAINTPYWLKFIYKNNELESLLSTDGTNFVSYGKVAVNNCLWNANLCIGTDTGGASDAHYFKGSINFNNSYININGTKYIFII